MRKLTLGILNKDRGIEVSLLLQSLLNQTFDDFDIIIIDDNNNNFLYENQVIQGLINLHKNLNHNIKIIKGRRLGPQFSGQLLLENSESELILRLDDDVVLQDDCVENLIKCFDIDDKVSAVGLIYLSPYNLISEQLLDINKYPEYLDYGKIKLINENQIYVNGILNTSLPMNLENNYIEVEHLHSGFMYKKKDMENIGGYFLGYSRVGFREESDVSYRLYLSGGKLLISTKSIAFHYHTFGGIYMDDCGQLNKKDLWENDEKLFIERFKNEFKNNIIYGLKDEPKEKINKIIENKKDESPLINIITVTHGNHNNLEKLIPSVLSYTKKPIHWIIINNDYSVESREKFNNLMEGYQENYGQDVKIHYKNLDKEVSVSDARNIVARLRHKDAEYLCFLDDDALILGQWSDDDWLDIMYKELNNELDIGAVSAIHTWFEPLKSYVLSVACLLVPVKVWEQVGGFDPVFGNKEKGTWGYEDTDWSYRLQMAGYKIKGIQAEGFPFYHEDTTFKEKSEWQEKGLLKAKELLISKYNADEIKKYNRTIYPFTDDQMECRGTKLNIGCYYMKLNDFINIDINPACEPDILKDIRELNFDKESIDLILASQVMEHFELIDDKYLFSKYYEWLKPGGHLIVEVPDVGKVLDLVENGDDIHKYYEYAIYGNQHEIGMKHKSQFDITLLINMLKEAGFSNIVRNPETSENDDITIRFDMRK